MRVKRVSAPEPERVRIQVRLRFHPPWASSSATWKAMAILSSLQSAQCAIMGLPAQSASRASCVARLPVPDVVWDDEAEAFVPNLEVGAPLQRPTDPKGPSAAPPPPPDSCF